MSQQDSILHNTIYTGPLDQFPASSELPEGAAAVDWRDTEHYRIDMTPQIVYAVRDGVELHINLLVPMEGTDWMPQKNYPLLVFVQGSGWRKQSLFQKLGSLVRICEQGYAVAIVEYRPSETAQFPAQVQDVKTAIRFLRKHGAQYRLNTEKIALWGDSSGGHTALMVGFTADSEPDTPDYNEYSARVDCIVDWYAPVNLIEMADGYSVADHAAPDSNESFLLGCIPATNPARAEAANPMHYLSEQVQTPPLLIVHGSRDHIVPFRQSVLLYEKMRALGKDVAFIKVNGAFHAFGGFHCDEARAALLAFIKKHIGDGING